MAVTGDDALRARIAEVFSSQFPISEQLTGINWERVLTPHRRHVLDPLEDPDENWVRDDRAEMEAML